MIQFPGDRPGLPCVLLHSSFHCSGCVPVCFIFPSLLEKASNTRILNFARQLGLNLSGSSAKSVSCFLRHSRHVSQSAEVTVGSRGVQLFLTFAESVLPTRWNEVRNCVTACCLHVPTPPPPPPPPLLLLAFLHVETHRNSRFFNNNNNNMVEINATRC